MRLLQTVCDLVEKNVAFTDMHLEVGAPVYIHAPGGYEPYGGYDITADDMRDLMEFANPRWKQEIESVGGFDSAMTVKGVARLRGNFFSHGGAEFVGAVLRKLPIEPQMPDVLDLPVALTTVVSGLPRGLVCVTGPTGSGKSTTIAGLIEMLNRTHPISVVTVERPIEYVFTRKKAVIVQREVPRDVPSFELGVKHAKRQDPDVIMVGEVDSKEAMDAVLTAACSGHLVFMTTHARSVAESVESMLQYYSDAELAQKRQLLASSLVAIQNQVLLPSADEKAFVLGYELLVNNSATTAAIAAIREGKIREIANLFASSHGNNFMISLNERLARLVAANRISARRALQAAYNKEDLSRRLGVHLGQAALS